MPAPRPDAPPRLTALVAARGIAALMVVLYHVTSGLMPRVYAAVHATPAFFLLNGVAAVIFFFVLSGFVLALGVVRSRSLAVAARAVIRRWPRLAAPVVLASLLYIAGRASHAFPPLGLRRPAIPVPVFVYWGGGRPLQGAGSVLWEAAVGTFAAGTNRHNEVLWTMRWELAGSFVALGLASLAVPRGMRWLRCLAFAAGALLCCWVNPFLGCFAAGAAAAVVHVRRGLPRIGGAAGVAMAAAAMLLMAWDVRDPAGWWHWSRSLLPYWLTPAWVAAQTFAALLLLALCLASTATVRLLERPALRLLGRLSFPAYLVHLAAIYAAGAWSFLLLAPLVPGWVRDAAMLAAVLVTTLALAWPLMRFDEWWIARLNRWTRPAPPR